MEVGIMQLCQAANKFVASRDVRDQFFRVLGFCLAKIEGGVDMIKAINPSPEIIALMREIASNIDLDDDIRVAAIRFLSGKNQVDYICLHVFVPSNDNPAILLACAETLEKIARMDDVDTDSKDSISRWLSIIKKKTASTAKEKTA